MSMSRDHVTLAALAITASATTTALVNKAGMPWGMIFVPAGSPLTSLTFYTQPHSVLPIGVPAPTAEEYFTPYDSAGSAVAALTVAAGQSYPIPEALSTAPFLRIVGNATGTITIALMG